MFDAIQKYFSEINLLIEQTPPKLHFEWNEKILDKNIFINARLNRKKQKIIKSLKNGKTVFSKKIEIINVFNHHLKHGFTDGFTSIMNSFGYFALTLHQEFKLSIIDNKRPESYKEDVGQKLNLEFDSILTLINDLSDKFVNSVIKDAIHLDNKTISANREENFNPNTYKKKWNEILDFPYWMNFNNKVIHQQKILNVSTHLFKSTVNLKINTISKNVKKDLIAPLNKYANEANKLIGLKDLTLLNGLIKKIQKDLISYNESYLDKYERLDLEKQFQYIPDELNVYTTKTLNGFQAYQKQLPELSIYPQSTLLSIYRKEIDPIIFDLVQNQFQWFKKNMDVILNSLQLAVFTNQNQSDKKILNEVVGKVELSANEILKEYELTLSRFDISIDKVKDTLQKVSQVDFVILNNTRKSQLINSKKKKGFVFKFKELQQVFSKKIVSFLNRVSPKIDSQDYRGFSNKMDELRSFADRVSIHKDVTNRIPSFYSQLFTGYHQPNDFYASFINLQLEQLNSALNKMDSHNANVLIVSGEPMSGKTFLINQFFNNNDRIEKKHIYPPKDLEFDNVENIIPSLYVDFDKEKNNLESLSSLPHGSVVVLDDFELWWRKSDKGFDKVNQWLDVFEKYSSDILFIVECNSFFLDLILKVSKIQDVLIQIVETPYFSGKQVEKVIAYKNKLANQIVNYKGVDISSKSFISNFFLYNQLSNLSGKNIGWLNLIWMSSLVIDDEGVLTFDPDFDLELPLIESAEEKIILLMIFLHKKLSKYDLENVLSHINAEKINTNIGSLDSKKLILIESSLIIINPVVLPYLVKFFKGKDMLIN
jgi:hypothetical protein